MISSPMYVDTFVIRYVHTYSTVLADHFSVSFIFWDGGRDERLQENNQENRE